MTQKGIFKLALIYGVLALSVTGRYAALRSHVQRQIEPIPGQEHDLRPGFSARAAKEVPPSQEVYVDLFGINPEDKSRVEEEAKVGEVQQPAQKEFSLKGISITPEKAAAFLGIPSQMKEAAQPGDASSDPEFKQFTLGDRIGEIEVQEITPDKVVLGRGKGEKTVLKIFRPETDKNKEK